MRGKALPRCPYCGWIYFGGLGQLGQHLAEWAGKMYRGHYHPTRPAVSSAIDLAQP